MGVEKLDKICKVRHCGGLKNIYWIEAASLIGADTVLTFVAERIWNKIAKTLMIIFWVKEYASEDHTILCMKSYIEEHRINQLSVIAYLDRKGLNRQCYLAGGFYARQWRILCEMNFEPLKHTLFFCEGLVNVLCNFVKKSINVLWKTVEW